eukprot:gene7123-14489_t
MFGRKVMKIRNIVMDYRKNYLKNVGLTKIPSEQSPLYFLHHPTAKRRLGHGSLFSSPISDNYANNPIVKFVRSQPLFRIPRDIAAIAILACITITDVHPVMSSQYDEYSQQYDNLNGKEPAEVFGVNDLRKIGGKYIRGNVLEVAVGTGLQFSYNSWENVLSYTGIDESNGMISEFDTVLDTYSMCVFDEPDVVLEQMIRVLKPNGRLILIENTKSDNVFLGLYQDVSEPLVTKFSKGCKWNTNVLELVRKSNLKPIYEERRELGSLLLGVYEKRNSL